MLKFRHEFECIECEFGSDEAIRRLAQNYLPSVPLDNRLQDKTQRHFGTLHSVSLGLSCIPL